MTIGVCVDSAFSGRNDAALIKICLLYTSAYNITFSPAAWADYLYWQSEDKKTLKRINKLLQELQRDGAVPVSYTHLYKA